MLRSLVEQEEARLRDELRRERDSNQDFARRCPGTRETTCYSQPPRPRSEFYTMGDYVRYRIDREHARFNPARCPTSGRGRPPLR